MKPSYDELRSLACKLNPLKEQFKEIRAALSIKERVGLGIISDVHPSYAPAALVSIGAWRGGQFYVVGGGFFGLEAQTYDINPLKHPILVQPNYELKHTALVSIYQRASQHAGNKEAVFEKRLLDCPDAVMLGFMAHEMTHWIERFKKIKKNKKEALDELISKANEEIAGVGSEVFIDVVAARYGYKHEIIAKCDYLMGCLGSYEDPEKSGSYYKKPSEVKKEIELRKRYVEQYA